MKRAIAIYLLANSAAAFSADPFTTPYKGARTLDQVATASTRTNEGPQGEDVRAERSAEENNRFSFLKKFRFFQFSSNGANECQSNSSDEPFKSSVCDSVFGAIAVSRSTESQSVKLNAVNYNLWLGGRHYLPFQIYVAQTAPADGSADGQSGANKAALFDPESGLAIKVPLMLVYDSNGPGFCSFGETDIGRCSLGGDISFHSKELKAVADSKSQMAYGTTVRMGGSFMFPVLNGAKDLANPSGYLGISGRYLWAHTNLDDSSKLFTPVLDAAGNAVPFSNYVRALEFEVSLGIYKQLGVTARWVKPIGNGDLFKDQFKLTLQALF